MRPLILFALTACGPKKGTLPTTTIELGEHRLTVEVADEPAERQKGLMFRKELDEDAGMLFVYPSAGPRSFWMENTSIPLSIAYMDPTGRILNIEAMVPFERKGVLSAGDAQYALEMNRGWFEANGVRQGDVVRALPGPSEH
ncbi:MAG: DUF192 domain-containing protein [Alphaproteobacteria bacterium]|nr:DUF192 domain-containing protein [Alphaproteobacteria bacterium]